MAGKEYSFVKNKITELLINEICPIGKEIQKLMNDETYLLNVLKKALKKLKL